MALLVQVTDGQSDISVAMAKAIGMLPADAVPGIPILYLMVGLNLCYLH